MRQCSSAASLRGAGCGLCGRVCVLGEGGREPGDGDLETGDRLREGLRDGLRNGGGDLDLGDDDLGRGDAVLDRANGKRVGDGELKGLGRRCAPGGARGWSVGQKLKRELESSSSPLPEQKSEGEEEPRPE